MPLHSLELLPDEPGRAAIRRDWQALRAAGLPSQLDHRGATNAPHLTVLAAPGIGPELRRSAAERIGPLLPVHVRLPGLVLLGGSRLTLARAVEVPEPLQAAVLDLRSAVGDSGSQGWVPHVTLARRLPRGLVQRAVDALADSAADSAGLAMTTLRLWDPDRGSITVLAGDRSAGEAAGGSPEASTR